jgi:hypothetical protein
VAGGHAYVADRGSGDLQVVDVSDSANPQVVGSCDTPGLANGVAVAGGYTYVAASPGGLVIVRLLEAQTFIPVACRRG